MPDYEWLKLQYDKWLDASSGWMKQDLMTVGQLSSDDFKKELYERFSVDAKFGTGGLRSIIRSGSNGINNFWIRRICKVLRVNSRRVVIAYDTRICSEEFAHEAAKTLSAGGCQVFFFHDPVPTPILSFAVKYLQCDTGIVITASHNPKEYNGFKLYDSNGVQYVPQKIDNLNEKIKRIPLIENDQNNSNSALIDKVGHEVFKAYFSAVFTELTSLHTEIDQMDELEVVYTPLHGTGAQFVPTMMRHYGIRVAEVDEQMNADPNFSTVSVPNPEDHAAFTRSIKKAEQMKTMPQVLIATDPDADRLGLLILKNGKYHSLTGNELGILLLDFILRKKNIRNYEGSSAVLKTIVTTDAIKPMAKKYNFKVYETLTGFKYLGNKTVELRSLGIDTLFSFEESYGYLYGTHAGDKDACSTAALFALMLREMGSGAGIFKRLDEIRKLYGFYLEQLVTRKAEGVNGMKKITNFMHILRSQKPVKIWEDGVVIKDYLEEEGELHSDVVEYLFQNGNRVIFRPSGTEPKVKAYINVHDHDENAAVKCISLLEKRVKELFDFNLN